MLITILVNMMLFNLYAQISYYSQRSRPATTNTSNRRCTKIQKRSRRSTTLITKRSTTMTTTKSETATSRARTRRRTQFRILTSSATRCHRNRPRISSVQLVLTTVLFHIRRYHSRNHIQIVHRSFRRGVTNREIFEPR